MNDISLNALRRWMEGKKFDRVADLGSAYINGAVKDLLPEAMGFDILPGKGVDVVLSTPGWVPPEYTGRFDLVTAIGALQCSDPGQFVYEARELLVPGGWFYVITCIPECTMEHTTSPGTRDGHRFTAEVLASMLYPEFRTISWRHFTEHPMMEFVAVKL